MSANALAPYKRLTIKIGSALLVDKQGKLRADWLAGLSADIAALQAGGTDNGPPGERHYHPGYYGAFVLDPDGNNIEAVFHGPVRRSAASVELDPIAPEA